MLAEPLPIHQALPDLKQALAHHPTVILQAPPGGREEHGAAARASAGRAEDSDARAPRLAARAVATRMAALLGEELGRTVGYRVRFENRVGRQTRL